MHYEAWSDYYRFAKTSGRPESFRQTVLETNKRAMESGVALPPAVQAAVLVIEDGNARLADAAALLAESLQALEKGGEKESGMAALGWAADLVAVELERAPADMPNRGQALLHLGAVMTGLGQLETAQIIYASAMASLEPKQIPSATLQWAGVLVRLNRHEKAAEVLGNVAAQFPSELNVRLALARVLARTGKVAEARTQYEQLLAVPNLSSPTRDALQREYDSLPTEPK